jgi:hypothetical protein
LIYIIFKPLFFVHSLLPCLSLPCRTPPAKRQDLKRHRQENKMPTRTRKMPFILLFAFLLLFLFGLNAGEVASVFEKAVTLCLACIGIG